MSIVKAIPTELSNDQIEAINAHPVVLISTIDHETGAPSLSAISWVKAVTAQFLRFAVTNNSRIFANLTANPAVTLCYIGGGTVHSITGTAEVLKEKAEGIAMPLAVIEVKIQAVFDSMFWGAEITQEPLYVKTYDAGKAEALDNQVYEALSK